MLEADRAEFDRILGELFAAIDKPLGESQRSAFWKGLQTMGLIELARCRDLLIEELRDGEIPRRFGLPDIWAAKRRLRAAAPVKPIDDGFRGDHWDVAANNHLMAVVLRSLAVKRCYNPEETRILVRYKNAWAQDMRETAVNDEVDPQIQRTAWRDFMEGAAQAMIRELAA